MNRRDEWSRYAAAFLASWEYQDDVSAEELPGCAARMADRLIAEADKRFGAESGFDDAAWKILDSLLTDEQRRALEKAAGR